MGNRNRNKNDKLSTGKAKKSMRLEKVKKQKFLSPDERIQYVIENSHLIKDKMSNLYNDVALRKTKLKKETSVKKPPKHLELLIGQPTTHEKIKPEDNSDTDFSDQNNSDSSKNKPKKTNAAKESEKSNKLQANYEVIQNATDTNGPNASAGQSNLNETKKVKFGNDVSPSVTYYQCDHCQKKFGMKSSLQRHMLMHLDLKPFSCSHCPNRKFRQRDNWRAHMARKHKEAFKKALKYECKICKKTFVLRGQLKLHLKAHADKKQHVCEFCKKAFKEKGLLAKHMECHMVPGRYKCATCSTSYDSRALYSDHLKTHRQAQDFSCHLCGKSYQRPSSIARHIRVSHSGIRRQCPICNKLLKGHLGEHMRMHENQRPYECDECGQRFTQSTQLTVHKRSHTGVRPYPCRICKQPFSHSSALMLHIRRHTGEKPFECAMCGLTFSQLPHMKAHMRNIHNKTEFYKCNNCNTFFKLKTSLEAHAEDCGEAGSIKNKDKGDDTLVSRIRFLLALHFAMTTSKKKLKHLGFNKRLIDDILVDAIEAQGLTPCEASLAPLARLQGNALVLLRATVPKNKMARFAKQNKTTEEMLELLTDPKGPNKK